MNATFSCLVGGAAAAQCNATLDGNTIQNGAQINTSTPGQHTFIVTALNGDGSVVGSLQRTYTVLPAAVFRRDHVPANTVQSGREHQVRNGQRRTIRSAAHTTRRQHVPERDLFGDGNAPPPSTFSCEGGARSTARRRTRRRW